MSSLRIRSGVFLVCGLAGMLHLTSAFAQTSDVFVCVDDNGTRTYQNTGGGKGCKKLNLEPLTSVPAPKSSQGGGGGKTSSASKFDAATADRDFDRRRILEEELRKEESKLAELKTEYNSGQPERRGDEKNYQKYLDRTARLQDEVARSEGNISALRKELNKLKE
jgi:hypothetical protein